MSIPELWSTHDDVAQRACASALRTEDLVEALLALEGAAPTNAGIARQRLSSWAGAVARQRTGVAPDRALRRVLAACPVVARPFTANPRSCHLSAVVLGQPGQSNLVGAIWLLVARSAGIPAHPVAVPGQIVLAVGERGILIDPARGGARLSPPLRQALRRHRRHPQHGERQLPDDLRIDGEIGRMVDQVLRDLLLCAEQADDDVSRFRAISFLSHLHPDRPGPQVALGLVAEAIGASEYALALYEHVVERFGESHEAAIARQRERVVRAHPHSLH